MEALTRAAAHNRGITPAMLRTGKWKRASYGLYVPSTAKDELPDRCRWHVEVLPAEAAFSGLTAAALDGWWLPPTPRELPIFATVEPGTFRPVRAGLRVRRAPLEPDDVTVRHGFRVTSPLRTLLDLAEILPLIDLVVVADSALRRRAVRLEDLEAACALTRRGIKTLRRSTTLVDGRSESPYETLLRLVHVLGDIEVEVQVDIYDDFGEWVARSDLRVKKTVHLPEYDGASHRTRHRHEDDLARDKLLTRAGYKRFGYTARDIFRTPAQILGDAEDGLGLNPDFTRVEGWLEQFDKSLFSRPGFARWARRWC